MPNLNGGLDYTFSCSQETADFRDFYYSQIAENNPVFIYSKNSVNIGIFYF